MQFDANTPRTQRSIGSADGPSYTVSVPQPYTAGNHTLTEGEASALNQVIAENLSNNLRKKIVEGNPDNNDQPWTEAEVQALVDSYLAEYEIGVRRAGGERRVVDPVEREARKIARAKAVALVKENGMKASDVDLDPLIDTIFDANRDVLMSEGAKIVKAAEKARQASEGLDLSGVDLSAVAPAEAEEEEAVA